MWLYLIHTQHRIMKKIHIFGAAILLLALTFAILGANQKRLHSQTVSAVSVHDTKRSGRFASDLQRNNISDHQAQPRCDKPNPAAFTRFLSQTNEESIDLPRAFSYVESFRLASEDYLPELMTSLDQARFPMAQGLIAQAILRIPGEKPIQKVFEAACQENDHSAREAIIDSFKSLESDESRDFLLSALLATDHPHILSSLLTIITETPTPQTITLLRTFAAEPGLTLASQSAIQSALDTLTSL